MVSSIASPERKVNLGESGCALAAVEIEILLLKALSECAVQVSMSANINLSSARSFDLNINVTKKKHQVMGWIIMIRKELSQNETIKTASESKPPES